jgi:WD40 repeat protein
LRPDGRTLAGASVSGTLSIFDAETGRELHNFGGTLGGNLAWSPDGSRIATVCGIRNVINGTMRRPADAMVRLWTPDGKPLATLHGHGEDALAVAFSPDGRAPPRPPQNGTVRLWDTESAREREGFEAAPGRGWRSRSGPMVRPWPSAAMMAPSACSTRSRAANDSDCWRTRSG